MVEELSKETIANQNKIELAQSKYAPVIIELMKDLMSKNQIIGKTEWDTIVNAITLEVQGNMLRGMVDYIEKIKQGLLKTPEGGNN